MYTYQLLDIVFFATMFVSLPLGSVLLILNAKMTPEDHGYAHTIRFTTLLSMLIGGMAWVSKAFFTYHETAGSHILDAAQSGRSVPLDAVAPPFIYAAASFWWVPAILALVALCLSFWTTSQEPI